MSQKNSLSSICLIGGPVYTRDAVIDDGYVLVTDGVISGVGLRAELPNNGDWTTIDVRGARIIPGLIDLHTHGMMGQDYADGDLEIMARELVRCGVTSFLATVTAAPLDELRQVVQRLVEFSRFRDSGCQDGARMVGIYLEGPFLSPCRPGALNSRSFRLPSVVEMEYLLSVGEGLIRVVTLAPELPGAEQLISFLASRGVIPAAGHTEASYERISEMIPIGLSHITHLFNAMVPFSHREPGIIGAALTDDRLSVEIIGDRHHLHPAAVELAIHSKGFDRVCLVSDSAPMAGLPDGIYRWLGQPVTLRCGKAQFDDGTLAGSATPLNLALSNLVSTTNYSFQSLQQTATSVPARLLGLNRGVIEIGYEADLVAIDEQFCSQLTMIGGRIVHSNC